VKSHPTIYFVQESPPDGPVKIGFTRRRVRERLAEGQTFAAGQLTLLVETFGSIEDETRLHRLFAPYRIRGEWFEYAPAIRELVSYLAFEDGVLQTWLDTNPGF
jgi:superfamily I DNA/RNA helicase